MDPLTSKSRWNVVIFQLVLLCVLVAEWHVFAELPHVFAHEATGAQVILLRRCTDQEMREQGDGRDIWVRLKSNGIIYINEDRVAPNLLYPRVNEIFSTRVEKVLYLLGDEDIPYHLVAETAANLQASNPDLSIFLPTTENVRGGPFYCLVQVAPVAFQNSTLNRASH